MRILRAGTNNTRVFKDNNTGFTLIEIVITIFIIGLFVSILVPKLPDITSHHLKSSSRRLANIIKYIRNRAIVEKQILRMTFDIDHGKYFVEGVVDTGKEKMFVEYVSSFNVKGSLPETIKFEDVITAGSGKRNEGEVPTHFNGNGFVEKTTIHLADNRGRKITIFVNSATGRVSIHDGYAESKSL